MTGVAAIPGNHIPVDVVNQIADEIRKVSINQEFAIGLIQTLKFNFQGPWYNSSFV